MNPKQDLAGGPRESTSSPNIIVGTNEETVPAGTAIMELYVCPICELEGIFRSHDKVQAHLSGFHNLPLDKQIAYGVLPQKKKLF